MNKWWGPGFHSSISLSTNSPSRKTYKLGTFENLKFGNFSVGAEALIMPMTSENNNEIFFSGLKTNLTYHSNPTISAGFHRIYYPVILKILMRML